MFLALLLLGCADQPAPVTAPAPRGADAVPTAQLRASAGLAEPCHAVRSTLIDAGGQRLHDRVGLQLRTRYPDAADLHDACEALASATADDIVAHASAAPDPHSPDDAARTVPPQPEAEPLPTDEPQP